MRNIPFVPTALYNKEVTSYIKFLIEDHKATCFSDLDSIHKDKLVELYLRSSQCDIELLLGYDANEYLLKALSSSEKEDEINLIKAVKESAYEYVGESYDLLIDELRDQIRCDELREHGFKPYQDPINGEIRWSKSA